MKRRSTVIAACGLTLLTAAVAVAVQLRAEPEQGNRLPAASVGEVIGAAAPAPSVPLTAADGAGSIAPSTPPGARPSAWPAQASTALIGKALPTNQWWTSALTGPWTQPLWMHPLVAKVDQDGLAVGATGRLQAGRDHIVSSFTPAMTIGGHSSGVAVERYGAFDVTLSVDLVAGGGMSSTLVRGAPMMRVDFTAAVPSLTLAAGSRAAAVSRGVGAGRAWRVSTAGKDWLVIGPPRAGWQHSADRLTARLAAGSESWLSVAPVAKGADVDTWLPVVMSAAERPVSGTTANLERDPVTGTVTERLTVERRGGGSGPWALLPHQAQALAAGSSKLRGGFTDPLGRLSLIDARTLTLRYPMPGLLPGTPAPAQLPPGQRRRVVEDLKSDLADQPGAGGSYFGAKEAGRLAMIAEVAEAVGATTSRDEALGRLKPMLVDWFTHSGPQDPRYFAHDSLWGGLIAVPAEFGQQDYNDHNFQFGYLVRAAATLAGVDKAFLKDYAGVVDEVVRDYLGTGESPASGLPAWRSFDPWAGHSWASGFAPFGDGNNQESSSEAVHAWEAVVRWGLVTGNADLAQRGATRYAVEAATARAYWLGESRRPGGYGHGVAGIVWDGKVDYATFFDPAPESVQGIQLLPVTFGALYRASPAAAKRRAAEIRDAVGEQPRTWGDLFAADAAVIDPRRSWRKLNAGVPREPSTPRSAVRLYVAALAAWGAPQRKVVADPPSGLAFGSSAHPTLVAVDPTGQGMTVTFRRDGTVVGTVRVPAGRLSVVSAAG